MGSNSRGRGGGASSRRAAAAAAVFGMGYLASSVTGAAATAVATAREATATAGEVTLPAVTIETAAKAAPHAANKNNKSRRATAATAAADAAKKGGAHHTRTPKNDIHDVDRKDNDHKALRDSGNSGRVRRKRTGAANDAAVADNGISFAAAVAGEDRHLAPPNASASTGGAADADAAGANERRDENNSGFDLDAFDAASEIDTGGFGRFLEDAMMSMAVPTAAPTPGETNAPTPQATTARPTIFECNSDPELREEEALILLESVSGNAIAIPGTPQNEAAEWVINEDPAFVDPCADPDTFVTRYTLAVVYFALDGPNWDRADGWLTGADVCDWSWPIGSDTTGGVICNDDGEIIGLNLEDNNLSGELPPELGELTLLELLNIFDNEVTGSIPTELSALLNLLLLDVESNQMTGPLFFDGIKNLVNLRGIRGSTNFFTGTIPTDIGDLTDLEELWAARTEIDGTIPTEIGELEQLDSVLLYETGIDGNVPGELFVSESITWVDISNTSVGGDLPQELYDAVTLEQLLIGSTELTGSLDSDIGNLVNLETLWLSNNTLTGRISTRIGEMESLDTLLLNHNEFTGPIPTQIGLLTNLVFLDLTNNFLSGSLPSELFDLVLVEIIYLSNNTITGEIPPNYDDPPSVRDLWLDGNLLSGTVPDPDAGAFEELTEFLFNRNDLTGTVPEGLCELRDDADPPGQLTSLHADCAIPPNPPQIFCRADCCTRCT